MPDDGAIGAAFRRYLAYWVHGSQEGRAQLYEEMEVAQRSGFPRQPAVEALSTLDTQLLWKTLATKNCRTSTTGHTKPAWTMPATDSKPRC
jgi:hypothetical protein